MRGGRRVCAAASVAAAFIVCCVCLPTGCALAGDDDDVAHAILFSGRDFWRNGAFAYGGMLYAPDGFEQDGLLFKLLLSGGLYRYNAGSLGGQQVDRRRMAGAGAARLSRHPRALRSESLPGT